MHTMPVYSLNEKVLETLFQYVLGRAMDFVWMMCRYKL